MNAIDIIFVLLFITLVDILLLKMFEVERITFVDPVVNYQEWTDMNWFGVIFFTLVLNVVFPFISVIYWFLKLCTVGRKE